MSNVTRASALLLTALLALPAAVAAAAAEGPGATDFQPIDVAQADATDAVPVPQRRGRSRSAGERDVAPPSPAVRRGRARSTDDQPGQQRPITTAPRGGRSGIPASPAEPFDPNRKSGLRAVAPIDDANKPEYSRVGDRWKLAEDLGINQYPWYDPYNVNVIKGDRPIHGEDWFFQLNLISDTIFEPRSLPVPVGNQTTDQPGGLGVFGSGDQFVFNQNLIVGLVYVKGNTTFKPPDHEFRLTPVINYNYVSTDERRLLRIDPREGTSRTDSQVLLQEAFYDYHIRNVSDRYDFDSIRIGIQPFSSDFRGFLFQDLQLGVRLFGTRDNNIFQYNLAYFRRLEKDINSGLNDIRQDIRADDVLIANVFWQDFPQLGFISQLTAIYNRNREGDEGSKFDENGFIQRPASLGNEKPRNYDVVYLGYNGDGHFGRLNLTVSAYYAFGNEDAQTFVNREADISAGFLAFEAGADFDWVRLRVSGVYATADEDPFDDVSTGFDAIFENPIIAGFDTNYWTHQPVPLVAGGGVTITPRNGMLNSLRSSKENGQSNFSNPGTALLGVGLDLDVTPQSRISLNANYLGFVDTTTLEVARNQSDIASDIGLDLSVGWTWRPFFSQNIVWRLSGAVLLPGQGMDDLFPNESSFYSIFGNLVLAF
ncbi:MAG: hypothetical protein ABF296_09630 [Oceanococcaceae bacterium]